MRNGVWRNPNRLGSQVSSRSAGGAEVNVMGIVWMPLGARDDDGPKKIRGDTYSPNMLLDFFEVRPPLCLHDDTVPSNLDLPTC